MYSNATGENQLALKQCQTVVAIVVACAQLCCKFMRTITLLKSFSQGRCSTESIKIVNYRKCTACDINVFSQQSTMLDVISSSLKVFIFNLKKYICLIKFKLQQLVTRTDLCVPCSTMRPPCRTRISWARLMVESLVSYKWLGLS